MSLILNLKLLLCYTNLCSPWHLNRDIPRIIRYKWLRPAKYPFCILRSGVHTSAGGWFPIIVVPIGGMNGNARSDEQAYPPNSRQTPSSRCASAAQWERDRFAPDWKFTHRSCPCIHGISPGIIQCATGNTRKIDLILSFEAR